MSEYIIGVDIGTTHTKAVAATTNGEVIAEEKANYPTFQPLPGYSEQDPIVIFEAVVQVLKDLLAKMPVKSNLVAVSFSAAMHSIMSIDHSGRPLTNLYTWADTRSNDYSAKLKGTALGERIYQASGTPVHPMSPLCKIAWIREQLPEIFGNTYKFISGKEYVFYRLFNTFFIDYSLASATGLFNIHELAWNTESLEFAGITTGHLSVPASTSYFETSIDPVYAQRMGLPKEVPFFLGASDGCLAILGSGAILPEDAALTIGTSAAIRKMGDKPLSDPKGRLFNYFIHDSLFMSGGATNNGGVVLKWFAEKMLDKPFNSQESFEWFMQEAASVPAGANGLVFLPYIQGERCPVWDANARGVFIGVHSGHNKAHFMRAILEGICFSLDQILLALEENGNPIETVYASGGFNQSPFWVQMVSDVLNKKIVISLAADASAMGAIFLAMNALGFSSGWEDARNLVVTSETFQPDPVMHASYRKNFAVYDSLYEKLKTEFATLAN